MLQALVLLAVLATQIDPSVRAGEQLTQIRRQMAENLTRLPNYTCRETIERVHADAGSRRFQLFDRLRLEVAYVAGRELYAWPGSTSFDDRSIEELVGAAGAISSGSFATHARAVFASNAAEFTWGGEEQRDGQKILRFSFKVPLAKSRYAIQTGSHPVIVPYTGFFEADAESLEPLMLEVQGADLPADLQLRSAAESIQYRRMQIGDSEFLLPVVSELQMVTENGREDRNRTRFEACKQYSGESTVRFDLDESGAPAGVGPAPIELPSNVVVETVLREAIDQAQAARGDLVHAVVSSDLKRSGKILAPKGSIISGRITHIETVTRRSLVYFGVGLHFVDIEFQGRRGKLSASVDSAGIGADYAVGKDPVTQDSIVFIKSKVERLPPGTRLVLRTN